MANKGSAGGVDSKKVVQIAAVCILVVCAIVAAYMFMSWKNNRTASDKAADIAAEVDIIEDDLMDFDKLHEINDEIYAYIQIPGTAVDDPIVQHADDTYGDWYYFRRGLDGEKLTAGCLFTEPRNAKDFSDRDTVIYGHNMRDGTMFATLHNYEDDTFMKEYPYVYVYTPEKNYIYKVFAAYHYDDRLILDYYDDFKDFNNFKAYIDEIFDTYSINGVVDQSVDIDCENDKILTLSTCSWSDEKARYLVQAVQLTDEEKQEVLHAQRDGAATTPDAAESDGAEGEAETQE